MDTLVRDRETRDHDEITWDTPAWDIPAWDLREDISTDEPGAQPSLDDQPSLDEEPRLAESGDATPDYLHPAVVAVAAAGYGWILLVFWVVFFGYGYMGLSLVAATLISLVMLGLMAAGAAGSRNVTPWQRPWRSFQESLAGEVQVWGARVSGRDAFIQLAAMSWCLAAFATVCGVLIELARP